MLNAIKKFLSSSSPSKQSPSHRSPHQKGHLQPNNKPISKATSSIDSSTRPQSTSLRSFNFEDHKMESFHPEIINRDSQAMSEQVSELSGSSKKRPLDSIIQEDHGRDEDEDPFTDKENKISGDNFMNIPDLLTKKQKVEHRNGERLKYSLSITKSKPPTSETMSKVIESKSQHLITTDTSRASSEDIISTQEDQEEIKDDDTEEEQEKQDDDDDDEPRTSAEEEKESEISELSDIIREEIENIKKSFKTLDQKYKLIDKIGEGTFSTVYKAKVLTPEILNINLWNSPPLKRKNGKFASVMQKRPFAKKIKYVALKRIYVTSSPQRIYNELNLLYTLTGCSKVAPLIDAIRHQDQVIAVLPYYRHSDFRYFYRDLSIDGIKIYMFELLSALKFVHSHHIIHRDIKPTNFLYDPFKRRGVLVDFGLAEKELKLDSNNTSNCLCYRNHHEHRAHEYYQLQNLASNSHLKGYPKDDSRPGRRANRAGTRGFRAPEVLFKCANQTSKIDMWSVGVVLLTLLARRFTFFNSPDDVDALVELTTLFGYEAMRRCANLHGLGIESSIKKLRNNSGYPMSQIIQWAVHLDASNETFADDSPALDTLEAIDSNGVIDTKTEIGVQFKDAIDLLNRCFAMNPYERITADDALNMPFFKELTTDLDEDVVIAN